MFTVLLEKVVKGENLSIEEMEGIMENIMEGKLTNSQIAGFLVALRMKGETVAEITGAARVMRSKARRIDKRDDVVIDTCGTGGDGSNTFNISTTVALVLAGAGIKVAKHGNRSVSSKSGSADVLEAFGVNLSLTPEQVEDCLNQIGIAFLFAPNFHKAMKYAITPRKELGLRTIFNILGPLTNPAMVNYQVLGVYDPVLVRPLAEVLSNLGVKAAMVVNGDGRLDEFTTTGGNLVAFLHDGMIEERKIYPEDLNLSRSKLEDIQGGSPEENKEIIQGILKGEKGPGRDVVVFNVAAALIVTGYADNWLKAATLAAEVIDSGKAYQKLENFIDYTNSLEVVV